LVASSLNFATLCNQLQATTNQIKCFFHMIPSMVRTSGPVVIVNNTAVSAVRTMIKMDQRDITQMGAV
jgi:hypothetical protein